MTRSADHIGDDLLSAFVDDQVTPQDRALVQAHLRTCALCQQRLDELRAVVDLLRALPDVPTPRDFTLGPRAVADPPNVVRLRRWYAATRVAAGSLAAVFVLLTAGVLYVDSRPTHLASTAASQPRPQVALVATSGQSGGERAAPPTTAPAVAPKAAGAAPATSPAPVMKAPQPAAPTTDQQAATTSTSALPTLVPTPAPTAVPSLPAAVAAASTDDPAPLRIAAIAIGILAVLALVTAVAVRHRLQRAVFRL